MHVLLTGGTGSIGGAVVQALIRRGHKVLALGRSYASCQLLSELGAEPVEGDLREPARWVGAADAVEGVIHAASTWEDDMDQVDRRVVDALLARMHHNSKPQAFVYTGGCWMYGATGDAVATEETPFDSLPAFAWAIPVFHRVLAASRTRGMVIHPAMVYERDGGVFGQMVEDARQLGSIRIVGAENVRWPLVHRDDLAALYALMLEQGQPGDVYNAAAIEGVPVGMITRAIARRMGINSEPIVCDVETAEADFGSSAAGYALDQQMSGQKAIDRLGWRPQHLDVIADIS